MKRVPIILLILSTSCCLQNSNEFSELTVMSWNVQNLFDDTDDGQEYSEFSVKEGLWNSDLYNLRLKNITKIIELNNPDIVALQEIEGINVLRDIVKILPDYKYFISTWDEGPIQIGFISRYPIKNSNLISFYKRELRSILDVTFSVGDRELHIINNHWKSKLGGFTETLRLESSIALQKRLSEIRDHEVLVLGDFNENFNEYQRVKKSYNTGLMFEARGKGLYIKGGNVEEGEFYTVWSKTDFEGSYKYKGEWETIDNFILNSRLMDKSDFYLDIFFVYNDPAMFTSSGDIKKWITEYKTGFSDHLPIVLKLKADGIITTLE